jgi:hypothetical protein
MSLFHPDLPRPDPSEADEIVVDVEVLGSIAQLRWSAKGIDGDPVAVARLRRIDGNLDDPVQFLSAVRRAFGDRVRAHLSRRP